MNIRFALHFKCFFLLLILGGIASSFQKKGKDSTELLIHIIPVFNGEPLVLSKKAYFTQNGDSVFIDQFKFYLSNLKFSDGGKTSFSQGESFLIDTEDTSSLHFTLKGLPPVNYSDLSFNIGVDSLANVSGAMDGALDPVNNMYWAWNTGYINAKITGRSDKCKTLHNVFEYHIGGYLKPFGTLQKVHLRLRDFKTAAGKINTLTLYADAAEWFKTPVLIDISKINSIVMPDKNAVMMAENYSDMFHLP